MVVSYAEIKHYESLIQAYERTIKLQSECFFGTECKRKFFKDKIFKARKKLRKLMDDYENDAYDVISGN